MLKTFKNSIWINNKTSRKRVTEYEFYNYYMPQGYNKGMKYEKNKIK